MKVIVAGSRDIQDYEIVKKAIESSGFEVEEVVSGTARGVDRFGEQWAQETCKLITRFPASWDAYGKRAGYLRNEQMAKYSDALVAVWDGESKGTKHMVDLAIKHGLKVFVFNTKENNE